MFDLQQSPRDHKSLSFFTGRAPRSFVSPLWLISIVALVNKGKRQLVNSSGFEVEAKFNPERARILIICQRLSTLNSQTPAK